MLPALTITKLFMEIKEISESNLMVEILTHCVWKHHKDIVILMQCEALVYSNHLLQESCNK